MKTVAIVLIVAVLAVGGCLGYELFNTSLQVVGKGLQKIPAADMPDQFSALRETVAHDALMGTVVRSGAIGSAADYSYYVYTLRIHNPGLVQAEMVELQIAPADEDVLFYTGTEEIILPAGGTADVQCVLLTQGTPHAVRDIYLTYYLWGHPFEVKFTYDDTI